MNRGRPTRTAIPVALAALAAATGAAAGAAACKLVHSDRCTLPTTTLGTYELMRDDADPSECPPTVVRLTIATWGSGAEQVRIEASPLTFVATDAPGFPTAPGGPLGPTETLAVRLDPGMEGIAILFTVSGLVDGVAVAAGQVEVVVNPKNIVDADVDLVLCPVLTGPECSGGGLRTCDDDGLERIDPCTWGCSLARVECNDCTPGATECHENVAITCDGDGLVADYLSCDATPANPNRRCEGGVCVNL